MQRPAWPSHVASVRRTGRSRCDREHVQAGHVELRRVRHVEHVPPEAQPVIAEARRNALLRLSVDVEVAVAAQFVPDACLTGKRRSGNSSALPEDRRKATGDRPPVLDRGGRRQTVRVHKARVALQVPVGRPARPAVDDVEREAAGQRIKPAMDQSPMIWLTKPDAAAAEAAILPERQVPDAVRC